MYVRVVAVVVADVAYLTELVVRFTPVGCVDCRCVDCVRCFQVPKARVICCADLDNFVLLVVCNSLEKTSSFVLRIREQA